MDRLSTCLRAAVLAAVTATLAACGGGGGGTPVANVPGNTLPGSATTSVAALIAYLQSLIAATDETSDPVVLGDAVLPSSETDSPTVLP